jgi:hypothetical protein
VRRSNTGSRKHAPSSIVPARGQLPENSPEPASKESCDVFQQHVAWSNLANDADDLEKESAALSVESGPASCDAEILTGETTAEDVDRLEVVDPDRADVVESLCIGPVPFEDATTERIDLDLPARARASRPLNAELKSTDAAKQGAEVHHGAPL